jgi:Txe/YoeB family toxin of toxin-antitoxin system
MYTLLYSPKAQKDAKKVVYSGLKENVEKLLDIIKVDPYAYPPEYEILKGKLKGFISRRINKQHRLVYEVLEEEKIIKVLRMWTHYE